MALETHSEQLAFPERFDSSEQLDTYIEGEYGSDVLTALRGSLAEQEGAVEALKNQGMNGQAESLLSEYRLHRQEFDRASRLLGDGSTSASSAETTAGTASSSRMEKVWNVTSAPFKFAFRQMKAHPFLTAGGIAALLYYSGAGSSLLQEYQELIAQAPDVATGEGASTIIENAPVNPGDLGPGTIPSTGVENIGGGATIVTPADIAPSAGPINPTPPPVSTGPLT